MVLAEGLKICTTYLVAGGSFEPTVHTRCTRSEYRTKAQQDLTNDTPSSASIKGPKKLSEWYNIVERDKFGA
jgi:hypothetical protein